MHILHNLLSGAVLFTLVLLGGGVGPNGSGNEICDNGIDDDGDGLIDCYDPDCGCTKACDAQYFKVCPLECTQPFPQTPVAVRLEWESVDTIWHEYSMPVIGDIDGDGEVEIIGKKGPFSHTNFRLLDTGFVVYKGRNGATKYKIDTTPLVNYTNPTIAIADLDRDGKSEMVVQASGTAGNALGGHLYCYEWANGGIRLKWVSDSSIYTSKHPYATSSPASFADIDHDGLPEVIVSHFIFDGIDGHLKAFGDTAVNRGAVHDWDAFHDVYFPVVADILPDGFCSRCQGLELAMGNGVYSVQFTPGIPLNRRIQLEVELPGGTDGFTSTCDFDGDGDLDIVYSHAGFFDSTLVLTVWDGQTPVRITTDQKLKRNIPFEARFAGLPILKDIDGDGRVEVLLNSPGLYRILDWENGGWMTRLSLMTSDKSGLTGSTALDFNHDGRYEIVYRDETNLRLLDALTGAEIFKTPCSSGTFVEYPVISDVDRDGEAEIVCGCGNKLRVYGSAGAPWPLTRSVWNQSLFYNVNIHDDLTVPIYQQGHHIVADSVILNNYLMPYAYDQLPAVDVWIDTLIFECSDSLSRVTVRVCNTGDKATHPNTPITVYGSDPIHSGGRPLLTAVLAKAIAVDSCITFTLNIPDKTGDKFYVVVNAPRNLKPPFRLEDFPYTSFIECDYLNNLDSILRPSLPERVDLGPDLMLCTVDSIPLHVKGDYAEYLWQDGSTDSIFIAHEAGTYWVLVRDICGHQLRDTVRLTITPPPILDIGRDTTVCKGEILMLEADSFDYYRWSPAGVMDCDTCETVHVRVDSNLRITVEGRTEDGCLNRDTLRLKVFPTRLTRDSVPLCAGDTLYLKDTVVSRPGTYPVHLTDRRGCDSIHEVYVWLKDGYFDAKQLTICPGDSALIFGRWEKMAGTFQRRYSTKERCDSIILIDLSIAPAIQARIDYSPPCPEDSFALVTAHVQGGIGPLQLTWDQGNEHARSALLPIGHHELVVMDSLGCTAFYEYEIVPQTAPDYHLTVTDESCPGEEDGAIKVILSGKNDKVQVFNAKGEQISPDYSGLLPGEYYITITDTTGCQWRDTVRIYPADTIALSVSPDTTIYKGDTVSLWTRIPGGANGQLHWTPANTLSCNACPFPNAFPHETQRYIVTYTDSSGCEVTGTVLIKVIDGAKVYIPNVFTPNEDGFNDGFTVYGSPRVREVIFLEIYDRWGELIFRNEHLPVNVPSVGWNGQFHNKKMPPGVYVYRTAVLFKSGEEKRYFGDVTLVR